MCDECKRLKEKVETAASEAGAAAAAFNWYFITKDPGAYAHNWKYAVQLLYDSYEDLRSQQDTSATTIPLLTGITRP